MSTLKVNMLNNLSLPGSLWQVHISLNGYGSSSGNDLVTQVSSGRSFELISNNSGKIIEKADSSRVKVRLLEDGYLCWLERRLLIANVTLQEAWAPQLFDELHIRRLIPLVLQWIQDASEKGNKYLWGGTLGPDFDCSGLVQSAFASEGIWLPRDAYQQERFCEVVPFEEINLENLLPGDLLFFGDNQDCNHVAIFKGNGMYWHSSGIDNGHNGIACDSLKPTSDNLVASYYLSKLRGAGRVVECHNGISLP